MMDGVGNQVGHSNLLLFEPEAVTKTVLRSLFYLIYEKTLVRLLFALWVLIRMP